LLVTLSYFFIKNRKQKRQIESQKKELEENARLKDKLFSIVAHDLHSPLISLGGIAKKVNFLIKRNRFEEIQLIGDTVEDAVTNVHKLLDNLLKWAMVQGGRFPHNPELIQAAEILEATGAIYKDLAEAKNIELTIDHSDKPSLFCDRDAASTIVRNLVDNAIKFTPREGKIDIKILQENGHTILIVSDSGLGISNKKLKDIFTLNNQKASGGTEGEKGTGLGLALCKELVEMNGGEIIVESEEGIGTTFWVTLPSIN
jgi:signal transduction histidine kinase